VTRIGGTAFPDVLCSPPRRPRGRQRRFRHWFAGIWWMRHPHFISATRHPRRVGLASV